MRRALDCPNCMLELRRRDVERRYYECCGCRTLWSDEDLYRHRHWWERIVDAIRRYRADRTEPPAPPMEPPVKWETVAIHVEYA